MSFAEVFQRAVNAADVGDLTINNEITDLEIYADPLLENVFSNLLDNSGRHGGHVSAVWVTSLPDRRNMKIVYEDNGRGIQGKEKEKIFMRGYGKNTGFGLFISREILSITGMEIKETGSPGKGARFEIRIPEGKGFLTAYQRGFPPLTCCKIGTVTASFVVEKVGCQTNLADWNRMTARYERHFGPLDEKERKIT